MNTYQLNSGLDLYVVGSALQKSLRRSNIKQALYFARELHFEGHDNYIWKRLVLSVIEDVGLADVDLLPQLHNTHKSYLQINQVRKTGKKMGWLVIAQAIHSICESMKNQTAYKALIWLEDNNSPLAIKGKASILSKFEISCKNVEEEKALNTMWCYMQKHRIQGIFDKMLEFSLVNCSPKVSNYIQVAQSFYRELLNKKKYQMPFLIIITILLVRASRTDKNINQYARESIKGIYSFPVPSYAIDQTVGGDFNKESDKVEKEIVYKQDLQYYHHIKTKY